MSKSPIKADAHAWLKSIMADREVSSGQKVVAWCLVEFINPHTARLCPSIATIAARVALHTSVVRKHLKDLHDAGWITIARSQGGAKSSTNAYALTRPTPRSGATPAPSTDATLEDAPRPVHMTPCKDARYP